MMLTDRQKKLIQLLTDGVPEKEIWAELDISETTCRRDKRLINRHFKAQSILASAVAYALSKKK